MFGYDIWIVLLGLVGGVLCGFLNTAASSGSAVSLPILVLMGLDPISANATNRIPVLIAGLSATLSFHSKRAIPWLLALKVICPTLLGSLVGVGLAELVPARQLGLLITAAVLVALILLFTKLKQAISQASSDITRYRFREAVVFFCIGIWLGFIVLDGATYLLLALTLMVGLNLVHANAIKSVVIAAATAMALLVFSYKGQVDWTLGAFLGVGGLIGGILGAKISMSPNAKRYVFALLVVVISAELMHLFWHYVFETH